MSKNVEPEGVEQPSPVEKLEGLTTEDGWAIGKKIVSHPDDSGGAFSVGYLATHAGGRSGFLKALDFTSAQKAENLAEALGDLLNAYNFERHVTELCAGANLDKVVVALAYGEMPIADAPMGKVLYIIFELAEGDVNRQIRAQGRLGPTWCLSALHQIAVGLQQLHGRGIFHQDLKPSNVLNFENATVSKLADLGRAHCTSMPAPHDGYAIPGDRRYAPPEQLYGYLLQDSGLAKTSADLYHLASMGHFLLNGVMLTPAVLSRLKREHLPPITGGNWQGRYEDVLPYLVDCYTSQMVQFENDLRSSIPGDGESGIIDRLVLLVRNLAHPDPEHRLGLGRSTEPFNIQRAISELDLLAKRLRLLERK